MDKEKLLAHINRAIVVLGAMKIRVDEMATIGAYATDAIQNLGEALKIVNEDNENEQESNNK